MSEKTIVIDVQRGDRFEFWARAASQLSGDNSLVFKVGERTVYKVEKLPSAYTFFEYTHYETESLIVIWNPDDIEISQFDYYNPEHVARTGVSHIELGEDQGKVISGVDIRWQQMQDPDRPQLRFSPARAWMNDPNGLCKIGDTYHMFFQFHPNSVDWGPMHWGHAISEDLYHWRHLPVFLMPQNNLSMLGATGGAFSGNAFVNDNEEIQFYYTERLPAYDLFKDYREIQKLVKPDKNLIKPISCETILECGPPGSAHDFRDPKVWFDDQEKSYFMVLASAVEGDPAVLLYRSDNGVDWDFQSVLYRAPEHYKQQGARCVECPDFFKLGDSWVLIMGFVGYTEPKTGRHNLLYAMTGTFDGMHFTPYEENLQELDFGTDYYAMQSFFDGDRQLAFAWLFNWEFKKPEGSNYCGEMSLPRELTLSKDNLLLMNPDAGLEKLRDESLSDRQLGSLGDLGNHPIELWIKGDLDGLEVQIEATTGGVGKVVHYQGRLDIQMPEDDGSIQYRSEPLSLRELRIVMDRGVIELFANGGAICGTRRSYQMTALASIKVQPENSSGDIEKNAWTCHSVWE